MEFEIERLSDGFNEERFGQTGRAGEQAVTAGQQGDQDLFDDVLLAHDDFGELLGHLFASLLQRGKRVGVGGRKIGRGG